MLPNNIEDTTPNKKVIDDNKILKNIGEKRGYSYYASGFQGRNSVNQTTKTITTWCRITHKENILLSHELGHIYFWRVDRFFKIISEIIAWIIAYIICKINKIDTTDFFKMMSHYIGTYVKKRAKK